MDTIYKYPIKVTDLQTVQMPDLAQILCVQKQDGIICLWARCFSENELKPRSISVAGTGNPIDGNYFHKYIGTVQDDPFIWHVFEIESACIPRSD